MGTLAPGSRSSPINRCGALQRFRRAIRLMSVEKARAAQLESETRAVTFESLYRTQWASLVRLGLLLTGSRELAEDLVHDAFLRLNPVLDGVTQPRAYLRATLVNLVRDQRRRTIHQDRWTASITASEASTPEIDETWLALQALPAKYRMALVLRYYADLSIDAVADVMGCRPGTAKSLVHRGLRKLKEKFEHD